MIHDVASRFDERYKDDRCPTCKYIHQNFIKISGKEIPCYKFGTIFIDKETRTKMKAASVAMLRVQEEDRSSWVCEECGKRC